MLWTKLLKMLAWPGYKAASLAGVRTEGGGNLGDGCMSTIIGIPMFILGVTVFWGAVVAVIGNIIAFAFRGHF
jgi:hypothetical protein